MCHLPQGPVGHRIQCRAVPCTLISNRSIFCFPIIHDFDICGKYTTVAAECLTVGSLAISVYLDLGPVFLEEALQNSAGSSSVHPVRKHVMLVSRSIISFNYLARVVLARFLHCRLNEFCDFFNPLYTM